jgi:hypothetical protein
MSKISIVKEMAEKAFAAESGRTVPLLRKAETFAAGIIVVVGFQLLDVKTLLESPSQLVKVPCYLSLAILSVSLLFAFCGMHLRGYADYPRGKKLWDNLKPENISEDAAQEAIVHLLLETREQNARLNDAKVKSLFWSGWLLFAGFLLVAISQLLDAFVDTLG